MFTVDNDMTINVTRGDHGTIDVPAPTEIGVFAAGDVLRLKIFEKKNCENVVLERCFGVYKETDTFQIKLTDKDTKFGGIINKPTTYWYEIELNPFTELQTIIGYDEDGPKLFILYPEGGDIEEMPVTPEEVGAVDKELSLTSHNAIENQAVARAIVQLQSSTEKNTNKVDALEQDIAVQGARINNLATLTEGSTTGDAELIDIRVGADGTIYQSAGDSVRGQFGSAKAEIDKVKECFDTSVNLYNENTNTDGYVISNAGVLTENAQYTTTDFIYLEKGQYTITYEDTKQFVFISKFNLNKEFIKRENTSGSFEITEDCYVRLSGYISRTAGKNIMLVKGTELPTEYVPYSVKIKQEYLPEIEINASDDSTVSIADTDFVKTSANLINQMTIEKYMYYTSSGVKAESTTKEYHCTDKIHLKPNTTYTCYECGRICFFDKEGNFKKANESGSSGREKRTFTTPDIDFSYATVNLYASKDVPVRKWQLNKGEDLLPYEPQHLVIDGYRIYDEPDYDDPITKFRNKDRIVFDKAPLFTLEDDVEGIDVATQRNSSSVFAMYDALMSENPLYIKKTELGADSQGNMLYRYDFNEPEILHGSAVLFSTQKPKVILISGIHNEYAGIYSLFNTMKQITTNPKLSDLRQNIHFIIVPVVNLYGVNNNQRKNENGIDLARNFEVDFVVKETSEKDYGGTEPLTENACQYIDALMRENSDAIFFNSCHNFAIRSTNEPKSFMWGCSATKYFNNLANKVIRKLTKEWSDKYDFITTSNGYISGNGRNNYLGSADVSAPNGNEGKQAMKYGIHGGSFEVCDYFHYKSSTEVDSSFVLSRGTETYINLILAHVYNYDVNF